MAEDLKVVTVVASEVATDMVGMIMVTEVDMT